jgi:hypothetical protein
MLRHFSHRIFQCLVAGALLLMVATYAQAQIGGLKKKIPGAGGDSGSSGNSGGGDVDSVLLAIDSARVKFAYARVSFSLADDIIRHQALRNTERKSAGAQVEKDKQELAALDKSIAEKRKLLAELGRQSKSGKYDENTEKQVANHLKADEDQRDQKKALIDQEIQDKEKNEKSLSKSDRDNYGKLARLLFTAATQEKAAIDSARDIQPRAQSAASNLGKDPTAMGKAKRLNSGVKDMGDIVTEGPKHVAQVASVVKNIGKIGGVDLTDPKLQPVVVTDEKDIPTNW